RRRRRDGQLTGAVGRRRELRGPVVDPDEKTVLTEYEARYRREYGGMTATQPQCNMRGNWAHRSCR
ncbi:hypothetical protein AB0E54_42010, partial [Amycolatopsis coloradensis]|uniref:hypothetical protein n=1 Tax=Amycolatopsis coloradensis TaxID=76021 RepID=UPI0034008520